MGTTFMEVVLDYECTPLYGQKYVNIWRLA